MRLRRLVLASVLLGALAAPTRADDLTRFAEVLGAVRAGDDAALSELERLAERVAADRGRDDVRAIAAYYAALDASERAQGLRDQDAFGALWDRVRELEQSGVRGFAWRAERVEILSELHALAEHVAPRADFVPAAYALSLAARIEVELLARTYRDDAPGDTEELLEQALSDARRAIELFRAAGQLRPLLEPLHTLARIERVRLDHARARALFQECLADARTVGDRMYQERALQGLASLARRDGDLVRLDRLLRELSELSTPAESWSLARLHAERLIHEDRARAALRFLEHNPPRTSAGRRAWHALRANALTRLGEWDAACEEIAASGSDPVRLARVELERGDAAGALELLALPHDRNSDPQLALARLQTRGEALLALDRLDEACDDLRAARDLAGELATRLSLEDGDAESRANVIGEVHGVHGVVLLAEALARRGDLLEAATVVEELQASYLRSTAEPLDLRAWADAFEAGLVTWVVGPDHSLRFDVPAGGGAAEFTRIELGRTALERGVRRLREALCDGREELARELGTELVHDLFPAAAGDDARAGGDPPRVLLLLHGPLERLPVEWLLESGVLGAARTPVVLPGLPSATPGAGTAITRWTLCGGPTGGALERLRDSELELAALAELHPDARLLAGEELTRAALLDALSARGALHVATHLVERDDGVRSESNVVLSNGETLSPADVRAADAVPELCVLATCTSGGGRFVDAEGAQGIAQAFLERGARDLVVTLWPVSDRAGREFSLALHRALLAGRAPSRAVADARAALRASGFRAADWAAFRALGRD